MEKSGNITVVKANDNYEKVHISAIKNLSAEELGIYVKIMSFGTQWSLNINGLTSVLGISKERVRKAIVKLEKEGYIVRKAVREDNGKMAGWDYFVYPYPVEEKDRSCAGKATTQESDNTLFQLDEKPTCRESNRTKKYNDKITDEEIISDYNKQQNNNKEVDDKSSTKKKRKKEVVNDFDFRQALLDNGVEEQLADAWLYVRKVKKGINTENAFIALVRESKNAGLTIREAVLYCCEKSWRGFESKWYNNNNNNYGYEKRGIRGSNKVIFEPTDSNEHGTDKRPF